MKTRRTRGRQLMGGVGLLVLTLGISGYGASSSNRGPQGSVTDAAAKKRVGEVKVCTTLDMHPFLYAGEFQWQKLGGNEYFDNQKVYLVRNGKIAWTYLAGRSLHLGGHAGKEDRLDAAEECVGQFVFDPLAR